MAVVSMPMKIRLKRQSTVFGVKTASIGVAEYGVISRHFKRRLRMV
jgi:hypothetical protein